MTDLGKDRNDGEQPVDLIPASWMTFGQRNILYIGFVGLLIPLGMALDGKRQAGTQSLGGFGFALTLCLTVSVGFLLINSGLLVFNVVKRRPAVKALIGCALPLVGALGSIVVRSLAM